MFKKKKIELVKNNKLMDFAILLLGATISAIAFNLFLFQNNIVVGFSGLSVIANNVWGLKPSIFLIISYTLILILSLIFLGKESTRHSIIGSIIYPLLVEATSYLIPFIDFSGIEKVVLVVAGALLSGFGSGLVYKVGYSTGGSDVLNQLLSKMFKRPVGSCIFMSNAIIILLGTASFGVRTLIYSIIVVYIVSVVVDKVMIGISQSKSFEIITSKEKDVKEFLISQLSHGVTIIDAKGGYTGNNVKIIMCAIPTKEYMTVKQNVLGIDSKALIMVKDVYEIVGNK